MSVWSPIILIALLLAPTVPSEPKPQNLQAVVPSAVVSISSEIGNEVKVTSSLIPLRNCSLDFLALGCQIQLGYYQVTSLGPVHIFHLLLLVLPYHRMHF